MTFETLHSASSAPAGSASGRRTERNKRWPVVGAIALTLGSGIAGWVLRGERDSAESEETRLQLQEAEGNAEIVRLEVERLSHRNAQLAARVTVAEDALDRVRSDDPPPESGVFTDVLSADEAAALRASGTDFCAYIESQMPRLCRQANLGAFVRGSSVMNNRQTRFTMVFNPNPYRLDSKEREIIIICDMQETTSPSITVTGERPNAQQDIARHIGIFAREHIVLANK